ncbi:MAG: PcfJ domain-containing protein [Dongiaceae bacterium]
MQATNLSPVSKKQLLSNRRKALKDVLGPGFLSGAFFGRELKKRLDRRVAFAEEFPLLCLEVIYGNFKGLRDPIDTKDDIGKEIARTLTSAKHQLSPHGLSTIAKIGRYVPERIALNMQWYKPHSVVQSLEFWGLIGRLNPNQVPGFSSATVQECAAFIDMVGTAIESSKSERSVPLTTSLITGIENWQEAREQLPQDKQNHSNALQSAGDVCGSFSRQVVAPFYGALNVGQCFPSGIMRNSNWTSIPFEGRNIVEILATSRDWHARSDAMLAKISDFQAAEWPPLSEKTIHPGTGLVLYPLTTPSMLREEGQRLKHCVGGYARLCMEDRHIISIRNADGDSIATIEYRATDKDGRIQISQVQIRGYGDGIPLPNAKLAAEWYLEEINQGRIEINGQVTVRPPMPYSNLEYDCYNPGKRERAWQEWRRLLPARWQRCSTADQFIAKAGFREDIEARRNPVIQPPQNTNGR